MRPIFALAVVASLCAGLVSAVIYPEGYTKESWEAETAAKIDQRHRRDVVIRIPTADIKAAGLGDIHLRVNQTKASFPMGTALVGWRIKQCLDSGSDDAYCSFARDNYNYAVTENAMKWTDWEPQEGNLTPQNADAVVSWTQNQGWRMRGHCLFWAVDDTSHYPGWVYSLRGDALVNAIHHRIETAMPHYSGQLDHWDVNNEMLHGNWFEQNTYDPDIRVKMFQWAQQQDSGPLLFVNDYNVLQWGEGGNYRNQIRDLISGGAPVGGIGLQSHLSGGIDLGVLQSELDAYWSEFNIPIWITEFDWNGNIGDGHSQHASELTAFYNLALSHQGVQGIIMWGFWDQAHWIPDAAICEGQQVTPNAAGEAYMDIFHNTMHTRLEKVEPLVTEDFVEFSFRGNKGLYDIAALDQHGRSVPILEKFEVEDDMLVYCKGCL